MPVPEWTTEQRARYWDSAYAGAGARGVSWFEDTPRVSLELIGVLGLARDAAVIDVGGGASTLVDRLVEAGFTDVSVLDVSAAALAEARQRLGDTTAVTWLNQDLLLWNPERRFDLWHDRAVFHFLVAPEDREAYLRALQSAVVPGGHVVLAAFAPDGPESCSGLPVVRYSANDVVRLLGGGFELVETRREEHVTPRGAKQPLTWVAGRLKAA